MMNIVQFAVIALIPVIILNKTMQKYVPEADDEKGRRRGVLATKYIKQLIIFGDLVAFNNSENLGTPTTTVFTERPQA